jgi:hypothetical protein
MRSTAARSSLVLPAGVAAVILFCLFVSLRGWYAGYRIYGDDLSVLNASAGSPKDWFVHGFSYYFRVYPEWSSPFTDFLRPGINAIVRTEELLFSNHYILYFLMFYVAQFLTVCCVIGMARDLGVGKKWLILLAALLSIEPAFVNRGLMNIGYQEDVWCGLLAIAALFFLSRRRYVLTLFLLLAAVFTKEAALFTPVAAALTVGYQTRRKLLAASMLLPLAVYYTVRELVFVHAGANSLHVLLWPEMTFKSIGFYLLRGILFWPIGSLADGASIAVSIIGSIALWILMALAGYRLFRQRDQLSSSALSILIWLSGALAVGVLVAQQSRLGGSIFPLELLALSVLAATPLSSGLKALSVSLLCLISISYCSNLISFRRSLPVERYEQQTIQQLLVDLRRSSQGADTTYILNSAPSFAAPEYLARAANVPGQVVVLNQFDGCSSSDEGSTGFHDLDASTLSIVAVIPKCARFAFKTLEKSNFDPPPNAILSRADFAKYSFADVQPAWRHPWDRRFHIPNLGEQMTISLQFNPKTSVLLYYDWQTAKYRCLGMTCGSAH